MTEPSQIGVEIEVPVATSLTISAVGPQGPAGLQNVVVSPTPPPNPFLDMIWIDTS